MSDDLPQMTSRQVLRVLGRGGWVVDRQAGGHVILMRPDGTGRVIVPNHPGDLPPGTLRGILQQAGLTREAFNRLRRGRL
jgi:predicted RNA binding protein YcfA (HicA-like mRNA interferase family)